MKTRCVFKGLECTCFTAGSMGKPLKISEDKACDDESDLTSCRTPGFKSLALRNCRGSMAYQSWVLPPQTPEGGMLCMVLLSCLARGLSRPRLQDAQLFHPHDSSPILAEETICTPQVEKNESYSYKKRTQAKHPPHEMLTATRCGIRYRSKLTRT